MNTIKMKRLSAAVAPTSRELLQRRAKRLLKLLRLDAPDIMLAVEVGLLAQAARELVPPQSVALAVRG